MKNLLRSLFSPILNLFEGGDEAYAYKPSHRTILIFMCCLLCGLATLVLVLIDDSDPFYYLPVLFFGGASLLGFIIGFLGSDRAVAKLWGSR